MDKSSEFLRTQVVWPFLQDADLYVERTSTVGSVDVSHLLFVASYSRLVDYLVLYIAAILPYFH